ncbi:PspC domain-containing protein [Arcticibacter tournemirensis]|uniref:PspC domain-containing protein n=1 Tax=Arcticibacter tournemirensis TaxID=699437 RepID=A0A4Q0MEN4_9SPHI|nr:PspC domain-containing protein [Arcticibacter tournemirensis]RXF71921.1 PspC domain-containing protein [Arcticibacter tournemirensis]
MNKTIIININGMVFHIEEDAYEVLRSYMTDVKRHFAYSADSDEIVTDIENRLAEMFNERLADQNKQVIVLQDVTDITARMGSVNDFDLQDEEPSYGPQGLKTERKLFRDTDDRIIGGVCSGIGYYFDMDAKWVRLITFLITLLWGTGLIVYIILWIVLPPARTRSERMAMKGEPINLQNFKKNFDEELESLKHQVRPGLDKTGAFLRDAGQHTGNFVLKALNVIVKVIGAFVIFICALTLFSLFMGLIFALGFLNKGELNAFPFNVINPEYQSPLYFSAFIIVIIPLLALIFFGMRVIFNRKITGRTTSFAMLIIWLTGLGMAVFYGSKVGAEFREEAKIEQRSDIVPYPVYYLKLNPGRFFTKDDSARYGISSKWDKSRIKISNDFGKIDLFIEKSEDGKSTLFKEFSARGRDFEQAFQTAQKSGYRFVQTDSILELDKYLYLTGQAPFRDQEVDVTIKVPVNTRLVIDGDLNEHLHNYNLRDCLPEDSDWKTPSVWVMTAEGMKCANDSLRVKNENR